LYKTGLSRLPCTKRDLKLISGENVPRGIAVIAQLLRSTTSNFDRLVNVFIETVESRAFELRFKNINVLLRPSNVSGPIESIFEEVISNNRK